MNWLTFDLAGPLSSYGDVAPGRVRDTDLLPSRSAVLGLLAAAIGIERHEAERQRDLGSRVRIASRVSADAALLRDYHTTQAPTQPSLKGRPQATRRDELSVRKDDLYTVLSDRYYYADYAATVGVQSADAELLGELEDALLAPRFSLYLGRKSCPLAWPLRPHRMAAHTWTEALATHDERTREALDRFRAFGVGKRWLRNVRGAYVYSWDGGVNAGPLVDQGRRVVRRDEPVDTGRRLFAERACWRAEQGAMP